MHYHLLEFASLRKSWPSIYVFASFDAASVVLGMAVLTVVILLLCCLLRVYDWCQDNTNAIKQEAIELQLSGASNVNHLPNSFDRRPTIEI